MNARELRLKKGPSNFRGGEVIQGERRGLDGQWHLLVTVNNQQIVRKLGTYVFFQLCHGVRRSLACSWFIEDAG